MLPTLQPIYPGRGRALAIASHYMDWPIPSIVVKIGSWYPKRTRKAKRQPPDESFRRLKTAPPASLYPPLLALCMALPWPSSDPRRGAPYGRICGQTARASYFARRPHTMALRAMVSPTTYSASFWRSIAVSDSVKRPESGPSDSNW